MSVLGPLAASLAAATKQTAALALRDLPLPPIGSVRLRTIDGKTSLTFELTAPILPTGYGGQTTTARPKQTSIVSYAGREPTGLPLEGLLDKWVAQASIESEIDTLERLCGYYGEPPALIVEGRGIPHSYNREPDSRYVLGEPTWGEVRTRRTRDGVRSYQAFSVTALRLSAVDADALDLAIARHYIKVVKGSTHRTLRQIARSRKTTWPQLRKLNPTLPADPDVHLPNGTKVRVA